MTWWISGSEVVVVDVALVVVLGVAEAEVNFATRRARVQVTPNVDDHALVAAVEDLGYQIRRAGFARSIPRWKG